MSQVTKTIIQQTRYEYSFKTPMAYVELSKAIDWALHDARELYPENRGWDDELMVKTYDDRVVIYFEGKS